MITRYQFFEEENLFIIKYIGDFSFEKYVQQVREFTKTDNWLFVENVLVDVRETNFELIFEEIDKLIDVKQKDLKSKKVNTVHLVGSPSATVISHLYQEPLKAEKFKLNYCTTIIKAKELLNYSKSFENLESVIDNLKNTH